MGNRPIFTYQEKLRSIRRRPGTKFVIVEGVDDVPAFCSTFRAAVGPASAQHWEVFQAEGKRGVCDFLRSYQGSNVRYIVDKDFDDIDLQDERLIILGRYSIENYYICQDILSCSLSVPLKQDPTLVKDDLQVNHFLEEVDKEGARLLKACFYYHRVVAPEINGEKPSWTDDDIYIKQDANSWGLCRASIDNIINKLLPGLEDWEEVNNYFNQSFNSSGQTAFDLPGKMLKEPLRRFAKEYYRSKKRKGGTQFNTLDGFLGVVVANLPVSKDFREKIDPVIDFLSGRAA
ncbi:DUF4435 domain-containing protein [uncultured Shewanella sp.]|uniref:DUF4435 domain-containing protein n=1 Tax=Shewanella atlantica TaxID=271099 RepID=UPI002635AEF2|nr:DUF4435 domain-containing protein [uncultured Shewanella sp.]